MHFVGGHMKQFVEFRLVDREPATELIEVDIKSIAAIVSRTWEPNKPFKESATSYLYIKGVVECFVIYGDAAGMVEKLASQKLAKMSFAK